MKKMKKKIAILGSTGSIGTQALDVIRAHSDKFEAYILTAGSNADLLIKQAREFMPDAVVIAAEDKYQSVSDALADLPIKVYTGQQALCDVCQCAEVDMVLTAMVGFAGLRPTVSALRARKPIALANKETLVVAGELVTAKCLEKGVPMLPVDSEHSAIFQCLVGEHEQEVEKIILTASGGPFRNYSLDQLRHVKAADALKHPTWQMGAKITIDSATLMNKGLEVIEAKWLFGVDIDEIEVLVHRQSIVHSAVQFCDNSVIAQLGVPDMKLPISYAIYYPERTECVTPELDMFSCGPLTFDKPDRETFRCLGLAIEAVKRGGLLPTVMNAANEVAVEPYSI